MSSSAASILADVFPGDSRMSREMRDRDWAATPLGPAEAWPDALKIPLRMMLTSRFEMWLGWGDDLAFFYNDAYVPTLGRKHPAALGRPMKDVWREVYDAVEDRIVSVMRDGVATWDKALMLMLERSGYLEETYHTFSYSPLREADGTVAGLMCVVTEETERIISERRLATLRTLAEALTLSTTRPALAAAATGALQSNLRDLPFARVKLFDGATAGLPAPARGAVATGPDIDGADWPFAAIRDGATSRRVSLKGLTAPAPKGLWDAPPDEALVVPIAKSGAEAPSGALVLGVNPHRPLDETFLGFAQLLAGQLAGALATIDGLARESAEMDRLKAMFEQSPGFMAVLSGPDHRYELVNPAYLDFIGDRQLLGRTVRDALPELERQPFIALLDRIYATGDPVTRLSQAILLQRRAGAPLERRFMDLVYQPMRDADGSVTGIFVQGMDVTSAHDAHSALRESEARFRTFARAMPNLAWTASGDGGVDWFNDQAYAYSGLAEGALNGRGWTTIVHPDDVQAAEAAWMRALGTGDLYEIEYRIRRADGAYRWHLVRALPVPDEDGGVLRWIGTDTDIHDRKLAEAESAASRERIWTTTNDLMGTAGVDGWLKAVNPAWTRLLGYEEAELLAQPFTAFIDEQDHGAVAAAVQRLADGLPVNGLEDRLIHKDGGRSLISWTAEPAGSLFHIVGRDITDQRAAEEALRQSQKMEAVGQLTGGIAHDFNNLLQGITGSLDLIQKRLAQGRYTELDRFVTGAMTSANRASALTHRLLAFSRRQPLDPRPVRANPLVASMEDLLRRTLGERIELELVLAGGLWPTLCDPNQLENAVLNLAINARDAMPDGGRLTIETCNAHLDSAYAARQRDVEPGQYVCIGVSDTGVGMASATVERAFEPFFTTKPLGQGTGLGLSMIYGFARQSEGYAKIYSEVGHGTTVKLYLPRHRANGEAEVPLPELSPAHAAEAGETVLVVEDEAVVRGLIVEVLNELGYRALEAQDGPNGLNLIQSRLPIDLLITDIGLPGLNGRQLADAARALRPELKVLFMTGYAENAALASGFLGPGMALITKPFAMEGLATKVRGIIGDG